MTWFLSITCSSSFFSFHCTALLLLLLLSRPCDNDASPSSEKRVRVVGHRGEEEKEERLQDAFVLQEEGQEVNGTRTRSEKCIEMTIAVMATKKRRKRGNCSFLDYFIKAYALLFASCILKNNVWVCDCGSDGDDCSEEGCSWFLSILFVTKDFRFQCAVV